MALFNNINPNPSQSLLDPFVRITVGNPNSKDADVFKVGDGKLVRAAVTLGEGKVQSNCRFTVRDPDKKLADKYFTYIESVGGLDPIQPPQETAAPPQVTSISNSAVDDSSTNTTPGKVIFEKTKASTYGWGSIYDGGDTGAYGDKIDFEGMYAAMADTKYKYAKVRVTNLSNNKSIIVKIVDRGPFAIAPNGQVIRPLQEHPDRKIDLVRGAWKALTNNAPQGLVDVKIEWLEAATVTSNTTTQAQTKEQSKQQSSKSTKAELANYNSYKIADWPTPKVGATKSIILTPGHRLDINTGTDGGTGTSLSYGGETRTVESVATEITVEVFKEQLTKAGYNLVSPPPLPSERGDAARKAYQDQVAALKASTGAYALELHFDEPNGRSGVISGGKYDPSGNSLSVMDVALGRSFGTFLFNYRKALGAPSRGITILEIDALRSSLANLVVSGVSSGNLSAFREAILPYAKKAVAALNTVTSGVAISQDKAISSVNSSTTPQVESTPAARTLAGAQITVELGYGGKTIAAYSFIHVGLKYSLFDPHSLEFTGQAASWVLTQRVKNTVYTNITFRKLAKKITSSYGMKLEMSEEGPLYDYFPQRGQTDYEALLVEARRIGYRVYTKGATLYIQPRKGVDANQQVFVLSYGENMGTYFEVTHQASTDSKGGARSSQPGSNNSTGERKFEIDPDTGQVKQKRKENLIGTGATQDASTTGSPLPLPAPKTTGDTDSSDSQRKANEDRIKGILANAEFPTTPEALTLDPDTPFKTEGVSTALDRYWVVDTVTHEYQTGKFITKLTCYSPIKNKRASAAISGEVKSISNSALVDGNSNSSFDPNAPKFIRPMTVGVVTSKHRSENPARPNHRGIDISSVGGSGKGSTVIASAAGTVSFAGFGANDNGHNGYGWVIDIDHGGGWMTRYAHLYPGSLKVTVGQQVQQGQEIGTEGNSGASRGTHLHTEIRKGGIDLNPLKFYKA